MEKTQIVIGAIPVFITASIILFTMGVAWGLLKSDVKSLVKDVDRIKDYLINIISPITQKKSPISLTPLGEGISESIKAEQIIDRDWDFINNAISEKNPSNPYDVQTISMEVAKHIFEKLSDSEKDIIKTELFNKGLDILQINPVFALLARDRYLKENDMNVDDIDLHDPEKKVKSESKK